MYQDVWTAVTSKPSKIVNFSTSLWKCLSNYRRNDFSVISEIWWILFIQKIMNKLEKFLIVLFHLNDIYIIFPSLSIALCIDLSLGYVIVLNNLFKSLPVILLLRAWLPLSSAIIELMWALIQLLIETYEVINYCPRCCRSVETCAQEILESSYAR